MHARQLMPHPLQSAGEVHGPARRDPHLAVEPLGRAVIKAEDDHVAGERHRIHHGDVDVLADAGLVAHAQRRKDADDAVHARQHVGRTEGEIERMDPGVLLDEARFGMDHRRIGGPLRLGPILPKATDRRHHEAGVAGR